MKVSTHRQSRKSIRYNTSSIDRYGRVRLKFINGYGNNCQLDSNFPHEE